MPWGGKEKCSPYLIGENIKNSSIARKYSNRSLNWTDRRLELQKTAIAPLSFTSDLNFIKKIAKTNTHPNQTEFMANHLPSLARRSIRCRRASGRRRRRSQKPVICEEMPDEGEGDQQITEAGWREKKLFAHRVKG